VDLLGASSAAELMAAQVLFWPGLICSVKRVHVAHVAIEHVWLHHVGEDGQWTVSWLVVAWSSSENSVAETGWGKRCSLLKNPLLTFLSFRVCWSSRK